MKYRLFTNTILLGGSSAEEVAAACGAGVDDVELWRQHVDTQPGGAAADLEILNQLSDPGAPRRGGTFNRHGAPFAPIAGDTGPIGRKAFNDTMRSRAMR